MTPQPAFVYVTLRVGCGLITQPINCSVFNSLEPGTIPSFLVVNLNLDLKQLSLWECKLPVTSPFPLSLTVFSCEFLDTCCCVLWQSILLYL